MKDLNEKETQLLNKAEIAKLINDSYNKLESVVIEKKDKPPNILIVVAVIMGVLINISLLGWLGYLIYIVWRL